MTAPRCRAIVLSCIDFRFVEPVQGVMRQRGLVGDADLVSWPGGALVLAHGEAQAVLDTLALARRLHEPDELVLVAHHDCGWLGGSDRFDGHAEEVAFLDEALALAAGVAGEHLPGLRVEGVRLDLPAGHDRGPVSGGG